MLPATIRSKLQEPEGDIPLSSEGGLSSNFKGEDNPQWYDTPQSKRERKRRSQTNKLKQRQTPRFQSTINTPVERMDREKDILKKIKKISTTMGSPNVQNEPSVFE